MLQLQCLLFDTSLMCEEESCQLLEVSQHEFANISLPCEGRLIMISVLSDWDRCRGGGRGGFSNVAMENWN